MIYCNCCSSSQLRLPECAGGLLDFAKAKVYKKCETDRVCKHSVGLKQFHSRRLRIKGSVNRTDIIQKYLLWLQTMGFLSQHNKAKLRNFLAFYDIHAHTHTGHKAEVAKNILGRRVTGTRRGKHKQACFSRAWKVKGVKGSTVIGYCQAENI